jgi:Sulfotransferase family
MLTADQPARSSTEATRRVLSKRIVFLVGAPRSGTTWLQLLLSRSPRIATANETNLFLSYTASLFSGWDLHRNNVRRVGVDKLMNEEEYIDLVRDFVCNVMVRIADRKPEAGIILEKSPGHLLYWRDIVKVFPDAFFLHIVRDPRSVVSSVVAAARNGWGLSWAPREVLGNCETWIKYVTAAKRLQQATPNFLQVTYEELKQNGPQLLSSIFSWIGIDTTNDECERIVAECDIENLRDNQLDKAPWDLSLEPNNFYRNGALDSWRNELTSRQCFLIEHTARDLMREFGYTPTARRKIIFPLVVKCRLTQIVSWRLAAMRERRARAIEALAVDQTRPFGDG